MSSKHNVLLYNIDLPENSKILSGSLNKISQLKIFFIPYHETLQKRS